MARVPLVGSRLELLSNLASKPWDPWIISGWFLLLLCFALTASASEHLEAPHLFEKFAAPRRLADIDDEAVRLRRKLNEVNKPAVKSIQSSDGDTIDCVPLDQQPALDHPLLKGHKIKERPASRPHSPRKNATTGAHVIHQLWKQSGDCPQGTIPIRRISTKDIKRAASFEEFGRKSTHQTDRLQNTVSQDETSWGASGHAHAIAYVSGDEYYGSKAIMNVWDPWIEDPSEFSLSQMWIIAGSFGNDLNTIEAGWQVSPELYGDNRPRFFIYWTADAYQQTGCYNLLCSGFVQTSNEIAMGAAISPWSSFAGAQYDISVLIWKDPMLGDWWMEFGDRVLVGYWPAKLFTHLRDSATLVEWGGEVAVSIGATTSPLLQRHTATHMGSGRFAEEGFARASYFRNLEVVNGKNQLQIVPMLATSADQPSCYDIRSFYNNNWENFFYYGGPGRNIACP